MTPPCATPRYPRYPVCATLCAGEALPCALPRVRPRHDPRYPVCACMQVPGLIAVMKMMSIVPWHGETRDGDLLTFTHTGSLDPAM